MKKVLCVIVVSMLLTAAILLSPAVAGAEAEDMEVVVLDGYTVAVENGELVVVFEFKGSYLSLYWDRPLDTSRPLVVTIWMGIEVIDAFYWPVF